MAILFYIKTYHTNYVTILSNVCAKKWRKGMIAICNKNGAFLYNCTEVEADKRIINTLEKASMEAINRLNNYKGCLTYDENGTMRKKDGMCGWLFMAEDLICKLNSLHCEAIYIITGDKEQPYIKYLQSEFDNLDKAYRKVFSNI